MQPHHCWRNKLQNPMTLGSPIGESVVGQSCMHCFHDSGPSNELWHFDMFPENEEASCMSPLLPLPRNRSVSKDATPMPSLQCLHSNAFIAVLHCNAFIACLENSRGFTQVQWANLNHRPCHAMVLRYSEDPVNL